MKRVSVMLEHQVSWYKMLLGSHYGPDEYFSIKKESKKKRLTDQNHVGYHYFSGKVV